MKRLFLITVCGALALGGSAFAKDEDAQEEELPTLTQPMKMGDARMTCEQIVSESGMMEKILGGSPASGLMDGEQLANVGTSLAMQGAVYAGAGRAAGAIGQVGGLLGRSSKKKKEEEALQKAIAEKRWIYMVGLYQGRNCDSVTAQ